GDFGLGGAAWPSFVMLGGFAVATVFLFLAGGSPVPTGVEDYEVEERIQVVMSDDLNNEIKAKVGKAIVEITQNHEQALEKFAKAAEEFAGKVAKLEATLDKANVSGVADQLSSLTSAIDLQSTSEALGSLKGSMSSLLSNLDDLSNLSSN